MRNDFQLGPIQLKWLESLETHPERQIKERLGVKTSEGYTACCLGELGLIGGYCEFASNNKLYVKNTQFSTYLNDIYQKLGLYSMEGKSSDPTLLSLSYMNDEDFTWPEIAAHVRANPTAYFNKSV